MRRSRVAAFQERAGWSNGRAVAASSDYAERVSLQTSTEKLVFCAREMHLAYRLAQAAPTDFVRRAVARHVVVRARDFIELAFDVLGGLKRQGVVVASERARVGAYRDAFDEYYDSTRTALSAHVQPLEYSHRLELWKELEIVKLSYFVDGAREICEGLAELQPGEHAPFAAFPEAGDESLAVDLQGHAAENAPDGFTRLGTDVLAATRANTVVAMNFTPVHQRAGELAALRLWIDAQWSMLQVAAGHTNAMRILKARIVTDVVSFADCLITRVDGDPGHRYQGLDDLLRPDGDPSAIDDFRQHYRIATVLDPIRQVRHRVGAHLHRDDKVALGDLLAELDTLRLVDVLCFYEKLHAVFVETCRRTGFLRSYVVSDVRMPGIAPSRSPEDRPAAFDEAKPDPLPLPATANPLRYDQEEAAEQLAVWCVERPGGSRGQAVLLGCVRQLPGGGDSWADGWAQPSGREGHRGIRVAHVAFLEALRSASHPGTVARLLALVPECARGWPEPLAETLLRYADGIAWDRQAPGALRLFFRALATLPVNAGARARAPLLAGTTHEDSVVATEATVALYRRLVEDQAFMRSLTTGDTAFSKGILPAIENAHPLRRLLALIALASLFIAGQPMIMGDAREAEFAAITSSIDPVAAQALGEACVSDPTWTLLQTARDFVGLAVHVSERLAPDWETADDIARAFVLAVTSSVVLASHTHVQTKVNLAVAHLRAGNKANAAGISRDIQNAHPNEVRARWPCSLFSPRPGHPS